MRFQASNPVLTAATVALATTVSIGPAQAQTSFFDMIFGSGASQTQPQHAAPARAPESPRTRPIDGAENDRRQSSRDGGATYRTVCVRACDGFFFPISFATTRSHFAADQLKCQASCAEAQLYVYRNPGEGIDNAEDLSGRAYSRLPNAFKFRKVTVEQCGCRPAPWSEAEIKRHQSYAAQPQLVASGDAESGHSDTAAASAVNRLAIAATAAEQDNASAATAPGTGAREPHAPAPQTTAVPKPKQDRNAVKTRTARSGGIIAATKPGAANGGPTGSGFGLFSMGLGAQPQYVWPGDAPRRR